MPDLITGKNPVLEALKAGRPLNKILLSKNIRNDAAISEILGYARNQGIPIEFVERQAIERLALSAVEGQRAGGVNQGVLAYTAARDYATLDELLAIPPKKGKPPSIVSWTASKTR